MEHIKYFLKFGEEEHLKELAKGILYCSTAEMFWSIENEKKIKGQGDILEARTKFHVQNVAVRSHNSSENATFNTNNFMITCDQAAHMPVFCLFSVYEDDCDIDEKGRLIINLPENKKKYIIDHFPEANAVAIITNPVRFLDDVVRSIGCDVKHEEVHYFNIDKGFSINGSNQKSMDGEYIKYIMQDSSENTQEGNKIYKFNVAHAYRTLFCKDEFFRYEQEYRIILPNETKFSGHKYPIHLSEKIGILSLADFFK